MAEKDLKPGDNFHDKIRDACVASDEIWILLSPSSLEERVGTAQRWQPLGR